MDLSKVKMVVSDMDGTLLNSNHQVTTRFFELFEALDQRGIRFVAASGRQYGSIVEKLEPIRDRIIVIAENGGFAKERERELVSTPLDTEIRQQILHQLDTVADVAPVLCGKDNAYVAENSAAFLGQLKEYYTEFQILEDLKAHQGEIMKIAVYHSISSETHIYPAVRHFEADLKVKVSGANWVDLSHKDAHKGHALSIIQKEFGISPAQTLVFGDYNNDLEMMAQSDFSFAMANAHPNVLKAAKYQTASNDDMGVERILEKLLQA